MSTASYIRIPTNIRLREIVASLLALLISQVIVYAFYEYQIKMAEISVQSVLNKNEFTSNPYKTSQAIESLEAIGLIKCSSLRTEGQTIPFFKSACLKSIQIFKHALEMKVVTASGQEWILEAQVGANRAITTLLIALQVLFAFSGFMLMRLHLRKIEKKEVENRANERLADLARKLAHDIRSPLSALRAISSNNQNIPSDSREIINEVVLRVNGIADDLLEHSRVETVPSASSTHVRLTKKFDAVGAINGIIAEKKALFQNFDFQFESKLKFVEIDFDKKMFERILSNLLNNSIEASKSEHIIGIYLSEAGEFATLSILDYGEGIPEEILKKIGKEEVSTKDAHGNGIGLYSAVQEIKAAGGDLNIQSKVGVGTQVVIRFRICGREFC